jgi:hypothetical protein
VHDAGEHGLPLLDGQIVNQRRGEPAKEASAASRLFAIPNSQARAGSPVCR